MRGVQTRYVTKEVDGDYVDYFEYKMKALEDLFRLRKDYPTLKWQVVYQEYYDAGQDDEGVGVQHVAYEEVIDA